MGIVSCNEAPLTPDLTPEEGKLVTVHFGTENTNPSTKATLTPNEGETAFQAKWENGDVLSVEYISPVTASNNIISATWDAANSKFSATLPDETGAWDFQACYPVPNAKDNSVDFGSSRTQKGSAYNSKYDIMTGTVSTVNSAAGKDDEGKDIVFPMTRQTAIAYFHFTSKLDEAITKATLTVAGEGAAIASNYAYVSDFAWAATEDCQSITVTFPEEAPNAKNFQLWFNVLPTEYDSMTLTVETATKTFTISKATSGGYEKGKLYKVQKDDISWTDKAETPSILFFYESFDKIAGTGANDGNWNGSIASNGVKDENLDNKGWVFANQGGASQCLKLGSGSKKGTATTPSLGITTSEATLWFKAGAWNAKDENTTISLSVSGNGKVSPSAITLEKGAWTEYECTISGADSDTKIVFSANNASDNRFFLDEVYVYSGKKPSKPVTKQDQTISFSPTSYTATIGAENTYPTLTAQSSGAKAWSSSDTGVATINAETGEITLVSAGTTTISVTVAADETYNEGTGMYELTVKNAGSTGGGGGEGGTTKYFVKVTSAPSDWSGEYLIVYEGGNVAFDGSLTTLDAVSNTVAVTISDSKIEATEVLLNSTFTINDKGTTIQSKSGYFIGNTSNSNALSSSTTTSYTNTLSIDSSFNVKSSGGAYLRYNATSGQTRFRYFKSSSYTGQKAIQLYKLEN